MLVTLPNHGSLQEAHGFGHENRTREVRSREPLVRTGEIFGMFGLGPWSNLLAMAANLLIAIASNLI